MRGGRSHHCLALGPLGCRLSRQQHPRSLAHTDLQRGGILPVELLSPRSEYTGMGRLYEGSMRPMPAKRVGKRGSRRRPFARACCVCCCMRLPTYWSKGGRVGQVALLALVKHPGSIFYNVHRHVHPAPARSFEQHTVQGGIVRGGACRACVCILNPAHALAAPLSTHSVPARYAKTGRVAGSRPATVAMKRTLYAPGGASIFFFLLVCNGTRQIFGLFGTSCVWT